MERENSHAWMWADWINSKRFFAPPVPKNILLALQKLPGSGIEPDAELNPAMVYYNMAINSMDNLDIAVWLIKTFNLKVYRSRKDAIFRLGFNNAASFYHKAKATDKEISRRYNQIRLNMEEAQRREQGVSVTYRNAA